MQAQGTGGPRIAAWRNHLISLYVDRTSKKHYYDPSYGKGSHDSVSAWESEALGTGQANTGGYSLFYQNKLRARIDSPGQHVKEVHP